MLLMVNSADSRDSTQKKTTETAMNRQAMETHGLSRSPTRANFQSRPLKLQPAKHRRVGQEGVDV